MPETVETTGFSRRTTLKAAAWSVPVVAAAVAVPAHAASGEAVDLVLTPAQSGDSWTGYSLDRSQAYEFATSTSYSASAAGGVQPTAKSTFATNATVGATFVVSYDNRIFSGPTLDYGGTNQTPGTAIPPTSSSTSGSLTTDTYVIPVEIPASPGSLRLQPLFTTVASPLPWAEDIQPYSVTLLPPAGLTDPDPTNSSFTSTPRYVTVPDAGITARVGEQSIPNLDDGDPYAVDVPETLTITVDDAAPYPYPMFTVSTPQGAYPTTGDSTAWEHLYTSLTIASATLNGADVTDSLTADEPVYGRFTFRREEALPAGSTLVVTLAATLRQGPIGGLTPDGGFKAQVGGGSDRDPGNDEFTSPKYTS